jgi:hypothetical protein
MTTASKERIKTIMFKDRLHILLVTGALTIGFVNAAHATMPSKSQVGSDPAAAGEEGDENGQKIEKRIIVTTGEADKDAPAAKQERRVIIRHKGTGKTEDINVEDPADGQKHIVVRAVVDDGHGEKSGSKEVAWLGVSTEESSEALTSQLGLQAGEGLLVTYVATDSPASKAGLQKNDLLVEIDGQKLVLPAQLRKLMQMHKEGDQVVLTYYRGGKKDDATATLGKTKIGFAALGESGLDSLKQLKFQLKDLSMDGVKENMSQLHEALARAGVDREKIQIEVRRGLDEARKAIAEAMTEVRHATHGSHAAQQTLEDLAHNGVEVDKDATVTIKSRNESVRTMVKTDDTGTFVVVANPKKHLTAHDKDGKLTFDGDIETSEQQQKVPAGVWEKVQPMVEQLNQAKPEEPAADPTEKKTN